MTTAIASTHEALTDTRSQSRRTTNVVLWTLQTLLAGLFLFAGAMKLVRPVEMMTKQIALPALFLRFLGIAEVLGALGLVLPWGLRIRRELTPFAAAGLVIIMTGATILMLTENGADSALMPFSVGCLLAIVAYGRWTFLTSVSTQPEV
jgi:uncharacterized membrane protein YphA (DoxX/SURF4 family)